MNRRKFIKMIGGGLGAASLGSLPFYPTHAAGSGQKKMLIVFQFGGNDGVNTLIPRSDITGIDELFLSAYNNRSNLKLDSGEKLFQDGSVELPYYVNNNEIDTYNGLKSLVDVADVSFFAGVGLQDGRDSRSHFTSARNLTSMNNTGWMTDFLAKTSYSAHALSSEDSLYAGYVGDRFKFDNDPYGDAFAQYEGYEAFIEDMFRPGSGGQFGLGSYYAGNVVNPTSKDWYTTQKSALQLPDGGTLSRDEISFPGDIGKDIETAARMFKDPLNPANVITVTDGGYDSHSNQDTLHPLLLGRLSRGLSNFYQTMGSEMDNTVVLVVTEFGRTINEIVNNGTDHGAGALYFAFGGGLKSEVYGRWELTDEIGGNYFANIVLDSYDVIHHVFNNHFGVSPFGGYRYDASRIILTGA